MAKAAAAARAPARPRRGAAAGGDPTPSQASISSAGATAATGGAATDGARATETAGKDGAEPPRRLQQQSRKRPPSVLLQQEQLLNTSSSSQNNAQEPFSSSKTVAAAAASPLRKVVRKDGGEEERNLALEPSPKPQKKQQQQSSESSREQKFSVHRGAAGTVRTRGAASRALPAGNLLEKAYKQRDIGIVSSNAQRETAAATDPAAAPGVPHSEAHTDTLSSTGSQTTAGAIEGGGGGGSAEIEDVEAAAAAELETQAELSSDGQSALVPSFVDAETEDATRTSDAAVVSSPKRTELLSPTPPPDRADSPVARGLLRRFPHSTSCTAAAAASSASSPLTSAAAAAPCPLLQTTTGKQEDLYSTSRSTISSSGSSTSSSNSTSTPRAGAIPRFPALDTDQVQVSSAYNAAAAAVAAAAALGSPLAPATPAAAEIADQARKSPHTRKAETAAATEEGDDSTANSTRTYGEAPGSLLLEGARAAAIHDAVCCTTTPLKGGGAAAVTAVPTTPPRLPPTALGAAAAAAYPFLSFGGSNSSSGDPTRSSRKQTRSSGLHAPAAAGVEQEQEEENASQEQQHAQQQRKGSNVTAAAAPAQGRLIVSTDDAGGGAAAAGVAGEVGASAEGVLPVASSTGAQAAADSGDLSPTAASSFATQQLQQQRQQQQRRPRDSFEFALSDAAATPSPFSRSKRRDRRQSDLPGDEFLLLSQRGEQQQPPDEQEPQQQHQQHQQQQQEPQQQGHQRQQPHEEQQQQQQQREEQQQQHEARLRNAVFTTETVHTTPSKRVGGPRLPCSAFETSSSSIQHKEDTLAWDEYGVSSSSHVWSPFSSRTRGAVSSPAHFTPLKQTRHGDYSDQTKPSCSGLHASNSTSSSSGSSSGSTGVGRSTSSTSSSPPEKTISSRRRLGPVELLTSAACSFSGFLGASAAAVFSVNERPRPPHHRQQRQQQEAEKEVQRQCQPHFLTALGEALLHADAAEEHTGAAGDPSRSRDAGAAAALAILSSLEATGLQHLQKVKLPRNMHRLWSTYKALRLIFDRLRETGQPLLLLRGVMPALRRLASSSSGALAEVAALEEPAAEGAAPSSAASVLVSPVPTPPPPPPASPSAADRCSRAYSPFSSSAAHRSILSRRQGVGDSLSASPAATTTSVGGGGTAATCTAAAASADGGRGGAAAAAAGAAEAAAGGRAEEDLLSHNLQGAGAKEIHQQPPTRTDVGRLIWLAPLLLAWRMRRVKRNMSSSSSSAAVAAALLASPLRRRLRGDEEDGALSHTLATAAAGQQHQQQQQFNLGLRKQAPLQLRQLNPSDYNIDIELKEYVLHPPPPAAATASPQSRLAAFVSSPFHADPPPTLTINPMGTLAGREQHPEARLCRLRSILVLWTFLWQREWLLVQQGRRQQREQEKKKTKEQEGNPDWDGGGHQHQEQDQQQTDVVKEAWKRLLREGEWAHGFDIEQVPMPPQKDLPDLPQRCLPQQPGLQQSSRLFGKAGSSSLSSPSSRITGPSCSSPLSQTTTPAAVAAVPSIAATAAAATEKTVPATGTAAAAVATATKSPSSSSSSCSFFPSSSSSCPLDAAGASPPAGGTSLAPAAGGAAAEACSFSSPFPLSTPPAFSPCSGRRRLSTLGLVTPHASPLSVRTISSPRSNISSLQRSNSRLSPALMLSPISTASSLQIGSPRLPLLRSPAANSFPLGSASGPLAAAATAVVATHTPSRGGRRAAAEGAGAGEGGADVAAAGEGGGGAPAAASEGGGGGAHAALRCSPSHTVLLEGEEQICVAGTPVPAAAVASLTRELAAPRTPGASSPLSSVASPSAVLAAGVRTAAAAAASTTAAAGSASGGREGKGAAAAAAAPILAAAGAAAAEVEDTPTRQFPLARNSGLQPTSPPSAVARLPNYSDQTSGQNTTATAPAAAAAATAAVPAALPRRSSSTSPISERLLRRTQERMQERLRIEQQRKHRAALYNEVKRWSNVDWVLRCLLDACIYRDRRRRIDSRVLAELFIGQSRLPLRLDVVEDALAALAELCPSELSLEGAVVVLARSADPTVMRRSVEEQLQAAKANVTEFEQQLAERSEVLSSPLKKA